MYHSEEEYEDCDGRSRSRSHREQTQPQPSPLHPLDSTLNIFTRVTNAILHLWVFKLVKIENLQFLDIPCLPTNLNSKMSHTSWENTYYVEKENKRSTSTLSMIYYTQKYVIIKLAMLQLISYCLVFVSFIVFKNNLCAVFNEMSSNDSNFDINMTNVIKYSLIICAILSTKSCLNGYCILNAQNVKTQIAASLYLSVYCDTLVLDINECNKQQILSIAGSDIDNISESLWYLIIYSPPMMLIFILCIIELYVIIGVSSLFGIFFMICIGIPMQMFGGVKYSQHNKLKMQYTDSRVQLMTELLSNVRVLKLECYEIPLSNRINSHREQELLHLDYSNFYFGLLILTNFIIPAVMLIIILLIYTLVFGNKMNADIILFTLMIFALIGVAIRGIPIVVSQIAALLISCHRIDDFRGRKSKQINIDNDEILALVDDDIAIEIDNGTFVWEDNEDIDNNSYAYILKNISLKIKKGKLIAIIGKVGSGKTSLIEAMLGEMKCIDGSISGHGRGDIIYYSQTPYIRNITVRENILLNAKYEERKYKKCIAVSGLKFDLEKLSNSDETLIGECGVNISGGQKSRVAFARALYRKNSHNQNLFIFDDPLSSVDLYVGKEMFMEGIYKYLLNRDKKNNNNTCLMVINSHLHLLKYFDEVIIMDNARIELHIDTKELFSLDANNGLLYQQYSHILPSMDTFNQTAAVHEGKEEEDDEAVINNINNININMNNIIRPSSCLPNKKTYCEFITSSLTKFDYMAHWKNDLETIEKCNKIKNGRLNLVYLFLPLIITYLVQCCYPICDIWILCWSNNAKNGSPLYYLSIWFLLLTVMILCTMYLNYFFGKLTTKSAHHIHNKSLYNILRANTLFFEQVSRGEIMNAFTTNTNDMDAKISIAVYQFILFTSSTIGYFVLIIMFIPFSLIPIIIFSPFLFYIFYRFCLSYSCCLLLCKDLEAPILTLFNETIPNLDSIRAYKQQNYFIHCMQNRVDNLYKCLFLNNALFVWLSLYGEILLHVMQLMVIICAGYQTSLNANNGVQNTQFIILCCWYYISIQQLLFFAVRLCCYMYTYFTSISRLIYYHDLFDKNKKFGKEEIHELSYYDIDNEHNDYDNWPEKGQLSISNLKLRYKKKHNLVLNIDKEIIIEHGSKVGICGRTGSGKSSILVSIFRLFEPEINEITIDNVDITKLGLYWLRSKLSIISQEPILFNGSLRFNLDPFDQYNDNEIWQCLKVVQLFDLINNRHGKLNCNVEENGMNFSKGQKQLLNFARSILKESAILFMDEATSSIDKNTDKIIQNLIRSEKLKNKTVITIAHRIETIIDYDYILVLQNGIVAEYDTPHNLLSNENSIFCKLASIS